MPSAAAASVVSSGAEERSLEETSARVAGLFASLKAAVKAVEFRSSVSELCNVLTPLRVDRGLPLNFPPGSAPRRVVDSAIAQDRVVAEASWIVKTTLQLTQQLKFRISSGSSRKIAVRSLFLDAVRTTLQVASLEYLFSLLQVECVIRLAHTPAKKGFPLYFLDDLLDCLLQSGDAVFPDVLEAFRDAYILQYQDLTFYVAQSLESVIVKRLRHEVEDAAEQTRMSAKAYAILQALPSPPSNKDNDTTATTTPRYWTPDGVSRTKCRDRQAYREVFSGAWMSYLQLDKDQLCLSAAVYQELLAMLPTHVLPFLTSPLSLSHFFLTAFQQGTIAVAIQALSGFFYLLVKHKLGDPDLVSKEGQKYYDRLLELVQPPVFQMATRVRFLRLLRVSLQSKLLPTEMRATFVKKLVSVAMLVPAGPATWLVTMALGLLQRGGHAMAPLVHGKMTPEQLEALDPLAPEDAEGTAAEGGDSSFVAAEDRLPGWTHPQAEGGHADPTASREQYLQRIALWEVAFLKQYVVLCATPHPLISYQTLVPAVSAGRGLVRCGII